METATERSWIELNIENLKHNVRILREAIPPACELMAVVKADAYGHGACATATVLNQMEITAFAVATVDFGCICPFIIARASFIAASVSAFDFVSGSIRTLIFAVLAMCFTLKADSLLAVLIGCNPGSLPPLGSWPA